MRIVVAQINPTVGDLAGNTGKILQALENARQRKADLVLFSELTICGYPPKDFVFHHAFLESMELHLERIVQASSGLGVIVGLVRKNTGRGEKHLFNSVAVIEDRKVLGFQDKWLLPTYDLFDELRYFEPGTEIAPWKIKGKKVGVVVCEDIWQHAGYVDTRYQRDPIIELAKHKLDVLVNASASPYQFQKPDLRAKVCSKAAQTLHCPVIMCCQVGANGPIIFDGYSLFVNSKGELCQLGAGFREDEMLVDLNIEACPCPFQYDFMYNLLQAQFLSSPCD